MTTRFYLGEFPTTRWSLVSLGRDSTDPDQRHKALADLCQLYWLPIYAFARRKGLSTQDAEDLTQEFCGKLANEDLLRNANPDRGKLRTWMLKIVTHDLLDARRAQQAQKRGGDVEIISIDQALAEEQLILPPAHSETPDHTFSRVWALRVLESAMQWTAQEYAAAGKTDLFTALRSSLDAESGDTDYETITKSTGLNKNAARQAVSRLRVKFREALHLIIADTLVNPTEADITEELRYLQASLS